MQLTFQCIKKNEQMDGLKNNWMHIYIVNANIVNI